MATLANLLTQLTDTARTERLLSTLVIHPALLVIDEDASRAVIAQALNALLFEDLLYRVPAAKLYVDRCVEKHETVFHDHGAVRTVDASGMGELPRGQEAITRILRPLGYELRGTYPLDRLKMTGRSYAQAEFPEDIAQFFISELHVDRFDDSFAKGVHNVTRHSLDPLPPAAQGLLAKLESTGYLSIEEAVQLLPVLVKCFDRQHPEPSVADYETLLAQSAEMAWIATEGNAFNHVTDRVADVQQLTVDQKALGQPMKDKVEVSGTGRVRQTAFLAARIQRQFRQQDGTTLSREVPGSFLEFIARDYIPGEATRAVEKPALDLSFDPSNAQAIFKMTASQ